MKFSKFLLIFFIVCVTMGATRIFLMGFSRIKKYHQPEVGFMVEPLKKHLERGGYLGFLSDNQERVPFLTRRMEAQYALTPVLLDHNFQAYPHVLLYCTSPLHFQQECERHRLIPVVNLQNGIGLAQNPAVLPGGSNPSVVVHSEIPASDAEAKNGFFVLLDASCGFFGLLLALSLSGSIGWQMILWLYPLRGKIFPLCLSLPLGLGITSCLNFISFLVLPKYPITLSLVCHLLLLSGIAIVRHQSKPREMQETSSEESWSQNGLWSKVLLVLISIAAFHCIGMYVGRPYGGWDAKSIWNLRAHSISRAGENWQDVFVSQVPHPDYPLLLPWTIVWGNSFTGKEMALTSWLIGAIFTFSSVGLLFFLLQKFRPTYAFVGTIMLVATPFFIHHGTSQYADIPLSYFMLAAPGLYILARKEKQLGLTFLSGLMAGFAAWTKNEGIFFLGVLVFCFFCIELYEREWFTYLGMLGGVMLFTPILLYFKYFVAAPGAYTNKNLFEILSWIDGPQVRGFFSHVFFREIWNYKDWSLFLLLAGICLVAFAKNALQRYNRHIFILCLSLILGYTLVMLTTQAIAQEPQGMWEGTFPRLLLHLWPLLILSLFLNGEDISWQSLSKKLFFR